MSSVTISSSSTTSTTATTLPPTDSTATTTHQQSTTRTNNQQQQQLRPPSESILTNGNGNKCDDEYIVHPDADHLLIRKDRHWPLPSKIEEEPLPQPKEWPEGIVISGISGRYPESDNLEEFWDKLIQGIELISCDDRRWPVGESNFNFFSYFSVSHSTHPASSSCSSPCNTTNIYTLLLLLNLLQTDSLYLEAKLLQLKLQFLFLLLTFYSAFFSLSLASCHRHI